MKNQALLGEMDTLRAKNNDQAFQIGQQQEAMQDKDDKIENLNS